LSRCRPCAGTFRRDHRRTGAARHKDNHKTFSSSPKSAAHPHVYHVQSGSADAGNAPGTFSQPVCIVYTTSCQTTATQIPVTRSIRFRRVHQGHLWQDRATGDQQRNGDLFRVLRAEHLQQPAGDCAHRPHLHEKIRCGASSKTTAFHHRAGRLLRRGDSGDGHHQHNSPGRPTCARH